MADNSGTLRQQFESDHSSRYESLETARRCAELTKPSMLPPEGHTPESKLHENYQSLGAFGINNLEGLLVTGLFPPLLPWFKQEPAATIQFAPDVDPKMLEAFADRLFLRDLTIQSVLESAGVKPDLRGRRTGFRSAKRRSLSQLLITGDTLERMHDDFRIQVFRRDHYVTMRDGCGDVLYHITLERFDPRTLPDDQLAKTGLNRADLDKCKPDKRMHDLVTRVEWQPRGENWLIEQECNGQVFNQSTEPVSPYFSTPFEMMGGENYGRGFIESTCRADLKSLDMLSERTLDWAGLASKMTPCIDDASETKEEDLAKPSGVPIRARVQNGEVTDIAFLHVNGLPDWRVVHDTIGRIEARVAKTLLIGSDSVRDSERTTKYEIQSLVVKQLEGALGGLYTPIADYMQLPTLHRTVHVLEKKKMLAPLPKGSVETKVLTGIAALSRQAKVGGILNIVAIAQQMGDEALAVIDPAVLIDVLARYDNIHEPGIIKSPARRAAEREEAIRQATRAAATEKAIEVGGNLMEASLTPQATQRSL